MLTFYGYKKCDTCRKAERVLTKAEVTYTFVDITQNPPTAGVIGAIAKQAGLTPRQMFNTSGVAYREKNIKVSAAKLSDPAILALLAADGRLIKRPLVTDGINSTVGFESGTFMSVWT